MRILSFLDEKISENNFSYIQTINRMISEMTVD
jgi:hypothetical protein